MDKSPIVFIILLVLFLSVVCSVSIHYDNVWGKKCIAAGGDPHFVKGGRFCLKPEAEVEVR
jgi:hypothetical protein